MNIIGIYVVIADLMDFKDKIEMISKRWKVSFLFVTISTLFVILFKVFTNGQFLKQYSRHNSTFGKHHVQNSFYASLQRHFYKNGTGLEKQFPVAWTYEEYNITGNFSCWNESMFSKSKEKNMDIVKNYPLGSSSQYLGKLGLLRPYRKLHLPSFPVIVTGASSNHYLEFQGLLYDINITLARSFKIPRLIFYDLGLYKSQRKELEKYCDCEVRDFPFDQYPKHLKILYGFAWKPVIIQILLDEYGYVLWLDTSMRFANVSRFEDLLKRVNIYGIASWDFGFTIGSHVDPETLEFLGEDPCLYVNTSDAGGGGILVVRSNFTLEYIMRPWTSCALTYGCMVNDRSEKLIGCPAGYNLGACQRFDQVILGIILWRLYGGQEKVIFPNNLVYPRRGHEIKYFRLLQEGDLK